MKTTKEVTEMESCSKYTATTWAAKHHVRKFGNQYKWTSANVKSFQNRNKRVGAPQGRRKSE